MLNPQSSLGNAFGNTFMSRGMAPMGYSMMQAAMQRHRNAGIGQPAAAAGPGAPLSLAPPGQNPMQGGMMGLLASMFPGLGQRGGPMGTTPGPGVGVPPMMPPMGPMRDAKGVGIPPPMLAGVQNGVGGMYSPGAAPALSAAMGQRRGGIAPAGPWSFTPTQISY